MLNQGFGLVATRRMATVLTLTVALLCDMLLLPALLQRFAAPHLAPESRPRRAPASDPGREGAQSPDPLPAPGRHFSTMPPMGREEGA